MCISETVFLSTFLIAPVRRAGTDAYGNRILRFPSQLRRMNKSKNKYHCKQSLFETTRPSANGEILGNPQSTRMISRNHFVYGRPVIEDLPPSKIQPTLLVPKQLDLYHMGRLLANAVCISIRCTELKYSRVICTSLSVCLPVCLSGCLPFCFFVYMSVYLSFCLPVCLFLNRPTLYVPRLI